MIILLFISPEGAHKAVVAKGIGYDIGKGMVGIEIGLCGMHARAQSGE